VLYRYLLVSSSAQRNPRIGHARGNGKPHRVWVVVDAICVRWHAVVGHLRGGGHWAGHVGVHGHRVLLRLMVRMLVRVLLVRVLLVRVLVLLRRDVIEGSHARQRRRRLSVVVLRRRL
jgi:hypothetical protein